MTEKILAVLFVFIKSIIGTTGYAGIALLMAIESACIPLPSELIMPFAGYLVYEGTRKLLWVATAGAIGCNLGSLVAYEIGRYGGRPLALPAGVARMPRGKFHVYTFLGSWPWCLALAYFGMKLGENWRSLGKYFHQFDAVIGVVLVVGIAWFIWSHWRGRMGAAE